jgi:hypothetical protein
MHKEVKAFIRTFSIIFPIGAVLVLTYGYFNGNFDSEIPGCMDSKMSNYNPEATIEDGSCISALYGCTETTAINYNSEANTDDGSCIKRSEAMKNDRETKNQLVDNPSNFKGKEVEINLLITSQTLPGLSFLPGDLRDYVKWANELGVPLVFKANYKEIHINVPNNIDVPGDGVNKSFLVKFKCNEGSLIYGNTATHIQRKYY